MSHARVPDAMPVAMLAWLNELATQGLFTTDRDLIICSWNTWLEHHTGRSGGEMIGRHLLTEFPELTARHFDAHYAAALDGEPRVLAHTFHKYFLAAQPGSPEPAQTARIAPLRGEDGGIIGTITMIEDVGDRVATERELRHQIATVEFARNIAEEAVQTKDEFLATLSHEIRTPLNAVIGWTKILQGRSDPALLKRALDIIERNATAQMHLIDDMLDMARITSGKLRIDLEPTDLGEAVLAAVDVIVPTARAKGVRLEIAVEAGEHRVAGDGDRLQQIVWNLLSNAVKFTEPGGEVRVGLAREGTSVRVRVTDTGAGIPPEFMPVMFERFRQAHASSSRRHGGLGLGLPLVKHLVELHGGSVNATSVYGAGSTFTVTIPLLPERTLSLVHSAGDPGAALEGLRILIVEDHEDARELTTATLEHYGAIVSQSGTAASALVAIDGAADAGAPFAAIVADLGLPGADGFWFIEQLRQRMPARGGRIPVIALTAYAMPRDRQRALAAGFHTHLVKPVDPDVLAEAIESAVRAARRRGSSPGRRT